MDASTFLTKLCILYILIKVCHSVIIHKGGESASYIFCPGDSETNVTVDLICTSEFSTVQHSDYISTRWTDITDVSNEIHVATIDNSSVLQPSDAYRGVFMQRLGVDRLIGSIRLQVVNASDVDVRKFNCEVTVLNDVPGVYARGVVAIKTCNESLPCTDTCGKIVTKKEILCPALIIAISVLLIVIAALTIYLSWDETNKMKCLIFVAGIVLGLIGLILAIVYFAQVEVHQDLLIPAAVFCFTCVVVILSGLSWKYVKECGGSSKGSDVGKDSLETGKRKPVPPAKPVKEVSKRDITVNIKENGGRNRLSPRKNSVEPVKETAIPLETSGPRRLPPLPPVEGNTPVKPMKKKPKKKKINRDDVE